MSKNLIKIIPHDEWVEKQKSLTARRIVWEKAKKLWTDNQGPNPASWNPNKIWIDPETKKVSRWLQCKSFSNYDESRFGPDPLDSVIDRLGIFEDLDFTEDIKYAEDHSFGPTTLIDRTGTPAYNNPSSSHYPITMVNDAEKIGIDLDNFPMFDSAEINSSSMSNCRKISNLIGLDYEEANAGAQRDYGYDSFHIQRPGQMLMYHHDLYYAVIRESDPELSWKPEKLRRFVVFLEDWQPGHVWIVGNTQYSHWKKGECITWSWIDMPHGTANLSSKPRYSIHLTGYMTEKSFDFYNQGNKDMRYKLNNSGGFDAYQLDESGNKTLVYSKSI
jgi:hypothetical protein